MSTPSAVSYANTSNISASAGGRWPRPTLEEAGWVWGGGLGEGSISPLEVSDSPGGRGLVTGALQGMGKFGQGVCPHDHHRGWPWREWGLRVGECWRVAAGVWPRSIRVRPWRPTPSPEQYPMLCNSLQVVAPPTHREGCVWESGGPALDGCGHRSRYRGQPGMGPELGPWSTITHNMSAGYTTHPSRRAAQLPPQTLESSSNLQRVWEALKYNPMTAPGLNARVI